MLLVRSAKIDQDWPALHCLEVHTRYHSQIWLNNGLPGYPPMSRSERVAKLQELTRTARMVMGGHKTHKLQTIGQTPIPQADWQELQKVEGLTRHAKMMRGQ